MIPPETLAAYVRFVQTNQVIALIDALTAAQTEIEALQARLKTSPSTRPRRGNRDEQEST